MVLLSNMRKNPKFAQNNTGLRDFIARQSYEQAEKPLVRSFADSGPEDLQKLIFAADVKESQPDGFRTVTTKTLGEFSSVALLIQAGFNKQLHLLLPICRGELKKSERSSEATKRRGKPLSEQTRRIMRLLGEEDMPIENDTQVETSSRRRAATLTELPGAPGLKRVKNDEEEDEDAKLNAFTEDIKQEIKQEIIEQVIEPKVELETKRPTTPEQVDDLIEDLKVGEENMVILG